MSTRGSKLSRAVGYFREADVDEARVAFQLVKEVMDQRLSPPRQATVRFRKPRVKKLVEAAKQVETQNAAGPVA